MPAHTRKRHIDDLTVIEFVGPRRHAAKAKATALTVLRQHGFCACDERDKPVPWREVFPESSPGTALKGARCKEGVTQRGLAEMTGIPRHHISEMENNKRPIDVEHAKIFGKALNIGHSVFLQ